MADLLIKIPLELGNITYPMWEFLYDYGLKDFYYNKPDKPSMFFQFVIINILLISLAYVSWYVLNKKYLLFICIIFTFIFLINALYFRKEEKITRLEFGYYTFYFVLIFFFNIILLLFSIPKETINDNLCYENTKDKVFGVKYFGILILYCAITIGFLTLSLTNKFYVSKWLSIILLVYYCLIFYYLYHKELHRICNITLQKNNSNGEAEYVDPDNKYNYNN